MKVMTEGHRYRVQNKEDNSKYQTIQFIEKKPKSRGGELELVKDGTTNEEIVDMLIDRMEYLNSQLECMENTYVITKLKEARKKMQARTDKRKSQGVLGKHAQHTS